MHPACSVGRTAACWGKIKGTAGVTHRQDAEELELQHLTHEDRLHELATMNK